jgi:hypothetical protein
MKQLLMRMMPVLLLGAVGSGLLLPAEAHNARNYRQYYGRPGYYQAYTRYERHPYLKRAGIGAAAGAGLGAVLAPDGARLDTAVKGGLIGAGAGLGYAYLKDRGYLNRW